MQRPRDGCPALGSSSARQLRAEVRPVDIAPCVAGGEVPALATWEPLRLGGVGDDSEVDGAGEVAVAAGLRARSANRAT